MNHILVYCVLIKSLESLAQATAQRCVTIWNICVLRDSALTQIRWGGKWVHLTQFYCLGHLCARNYQS